MNIQQLISSTGEVPNLSGKVFNRGQGQVFKKPFGAIYIYNKTIKTKSNSSIVEITMMIKAATEKTAAVHKAMVSIRGVEHKHCTAKELVSLVKTTHSEYADIDDNDLINAILENQIKPFESKTVLKTTDNDGYNIINDNIPYNSEIRVWCSCSDYYWTFQYYNVENKVDIFGRYPERYIPKTKKGFEAFKVNKPLRNPKRKPGMCKHLMLLMALLMKDDIVQPTAGKTSLLKSFNVNYKKFEKVQKLSTEEYEKLLNDYKSAHRLVASHRNLAHTNYGYGSSISSKKTGWDRKNLRWDEPSKRWKKW